MTQPKTEHSFPSTKDFLLTVPLYKSYEITPENAKEVILLEFNDKPIDSYCLHCDKRTDFLSETSFPMANIKNPNSSNTRKITSSTDLIRIFDTKITDTDLSPNRTIDLNFGVPAFNTKYVAFKDLLHVATHTRSFEVRFFCPHDNSHKIRFVFNIFQEKIEKIGQFPTIADLHEYKIRQYKPLLGNERYKELAKGIGLTSHGVGIGAFVYLRRIFESLINEAHIEAQQISKRWNEKLFQKSKMEDKIQILKTYLPDYLVTNRKIYGILSKGIHELGEQECLEYFDVLKIGIEVILDQKLEKKRLEEKSKSINKAITDIHTKLK